MIFKKIVKYLISVFLFLQLLDVKAQSSFALGFNSTAGGRSVVSQYNIKKQKNEFSIGLRYNVNYSHHIDDQGKLFYKRIHAQNTLQHLGIVLTYKRDIFSNQKFSNVFLFYDLQATYSLAKNHHYRLSWGDSIDPIQYTYLDIRLGPFTWVEQNIGIGHKLKLNSKFYLFQKVGIGTLFIIGKEKTAIQEKIHTLHYFKRFSWEFGSLYNIGLGYNF
jgi:hypothetical protein